MKDNSRFFLCHTEQAIKLLLVFFLPVLVWSCKDETLSETLVPNRPNIEWQYKGLKGLIIQDVLISEQFVFASTNRGLYQASRVSFFSKDETKWSLLTSKDWEFLDIILTSDSSLIGSVVHRGVNLLALSHDMGRNWTTSTSQFGFGESRNFENINRLFWDPVSESLFGVGTDVLAISNAEASSWELLSGLWQGFGRGMFAVTYDRESNIAFYGGQGAFENPILRKVDLSTLATEFIDVTDYLPQPSTIESIIIIKEGQTVIASGEGGIIRSDDYGETWNSLLKNSEARFYFDFIVDKNDSDSVFTVGWNKSFDEPQPLILEYTTDKGASWHSEAYDEDNIFGGGKSIAAIQSEQTINLAVGLYKGGIFTITIDK
ncbi:hypothetical protein DRW07_09045 [Alteromonas sediminis]|uniref:Photosynthesis system II assembly factor Ycf48/Hcf136-like domain-containing protein n=1 Tax=Alteromonas sediminis TaxID=2259342 RepID=A0A3N5YDI8_9ALTE|nr:hypothetical protein [Alteromonas sediminis]RPJ67645.1 hypothetical protein DRW07_09045 [Alteromonas sediminis]